MVSILLYVIDAPGLLNRFEDGGCFVVDLSKRFGAFFSDVDGAVLTCRVCGGSQIGVVSERF